MATTGRWWPCHDGELARALCASARCLTRSIALFGGAKRAANGDSGPAQHRRVGITSAAVNLLRP